MAEMNKNLLEVYNLKKHFPVKAGILRRTVGQVKAVDGISFTIERGKTFGLVGESGCGKTTAGRTLIALYQPTEGEMFFDVKPEIIARMRELETQLQAGNIENVKEFNELKSQYDIYSFKKRQLREARSNFQNDVSGPLWVSKPPNSCG
jgi:ABC-type oligopeptide transport system ATPase subunit